MPAPVVASLAKRAGVSRKRAEHLWDKAKAVVKDEYGEDQPAAGESGDSYYKKVMGVFKKMIGLKEETEPVIEADTADVLRSLGVRPEVVECLEQP